MSERARQVAGGLVLLEMLLFIGQFISLGISCHRLFYGNHDELDYAVARTMGSVLMAFGVLINWQVLQRV